MDYYAMTDRAIGVELGNRIKALRLRKNLTQQQIADAVSLSLNSIKSLEAGGGKISTLIAVLRELGSLDGIAQLIPEPPVSPLQLAKSHGKQRQRASRRQLSSSSEEDSEW